MSEKKIKETENKTNQDICYKYIPVSVYDVKPIV